MFEHELHLVEQCTPMTVTGRVSHVTGLTVLADGLLAPVGAIARITPFGGPSIDAQVVGFRSTTAVLMPLREPRGVSEGDPVTASAAMQTVPVGRQMLGCVLDGMGRVISAGEGGRDDFTVEAQYPVYTTPPAPLARRPILKVIATGVRSIDALHTVGGGQRMGVFAGTGVGKSVLMGMIARNTAADVTVVSLVGERGREVGDFLRKDLGEEGRKRTVMVVSTSDESPVLRVRACFVATAIAEYFRDLGRHVLLMMDSVTRVATAQREIGLAAGEPPATKGHTPSVFGLLPRLLERAGNTERGSITGLYTVLVEGDDINEPISDAVRGTLDGHVWLSRALANRSHYPAVSVLESISRVMVDVTDQEHLKAAAEVRSVLAVWSEIEDLVNIGAYAKGNNVEYDVAVAMKPRIDAFLRQRIQDRVTFAESRTALIELAREITTVRQESAVAA
ncbi:MAG: FliI/YscN family ATPase [Phycisphaerales bacterium]|nr:MAG: FliI/YscN family ATPase [Phycisphaerales bacterium]